MIWDGFANTCYVISIFEVTFVIAFDIEIVTAIWAFDYFLDYVNLIDIFLISFTQIERPEGPIEMDSSNKIGREMLMRQVSILFLRQ